MKTVPLHFAKHYESEYDLTFRAETPFVCYRLYIIRGPRAVIVDYSVGSSIRNVHQGKYPDRSVPELIGIGQAAAQRDFDERVSRCLAEYQ